MLRRAFHILEGLPTDQKRDDLLVGTAFELSRVCGSLGNTGEVLQYLDRAAADLPTATPAQVVALSGAYARLYYVQGNLAKATEFSQRCLSLAKDALSLQRFLNLPSNIMGRILCVSGKFGQAADVLARGCEMAHDAAEYGELSHSQGLCAVALGMMGKFVEARESIDTCVRIACKLEDPIRVLGSFLYSSALAEARYDWDHGIDQAAKLLAFAEAQSIGGLYVYVGTVYAGRHHFHLGHISRAQVLLSNAINLAISLHISMLVAWAYAYLGDVLFVAGDFEAAQATYQKGLQLSNVGSGDDYAGPLNMIGLAQIASYRDGNATAVRTLAEQALSRLERAQNRSARVVVLQRYAEALETARDQAAAASVWLRHAEEVAQLDIEEPEFWPRIPGIRTSSQDAKKFWLAQRTIVVSPITATVQLTSSAPFKETMAPTETASVLPLSSLPFTNTVEPVAAQPEVDSAPADATITPER